MIALILNPHDVSLGPETMQFIHDETLVVIIAPAAGHAHDDLILLHREHSEQVEQGHNQSRPDRASNGADYCPNSSSDGHSFLIDGGDINILVLG